MHECIQELSIVFLQLNWRNLVLLTCYMTYTLMSLWNVVATIFARWSAYLLLQKRCEVIGYECSWGKHIFILFFFWSRSPSTLIGFWLSFCTSTLRTCIWLPGCRWCCLSSLVWIVLWPGRCCMSVLLLASFALCFWNILCILSVRSWHTRN